MKIEIKGGATLGLTSNATLVTDRVSGDHTGQLNILQGQSFLLNSEYSLMPFSMLAHDNTSVTLSESLDCKNVEILLYGKFWRVLSCTDSVTVCGIEPRGWI